MLHQVYPVQKVVSKKRKGVLNYQYGNNDNSDLMNDKLLDN